MGWVKKLRLSMAGALAASLIATVLILVLEGRGREALPLHLCGLSAMAAVLLAMKPRAILLDCLWYLGMPGALLALLFPAPAVSRYQLAMNASYAVTHLLILLIPLFLIAVGMRPRGGMAAKMLALLDAAALPVCAVNAALGTDYLFLSAPPAGTPLEVLFSLGYPAYLICLQLLMLLCCMGMEKLAGLLSRTGGNDPALFVCTKTELCCIII